mmetsp:Transcript_29138/g.38322  ORF Transcript_29138/g.38322 Transcript_29138/m.38322 type:complete len:162 (-) Transcript_29138:178-663(-)
MLSNFTRYVFLIYFVTHIPTTLLIDMQAIFSEFYPESLKNLLQWHIETNGDFLMATLPLWFRSVIWGEYVMQLPFFFVASYAFYKGANWIRIPTIIYGSHVATTMIPILSEILYSPEMTAGSTARIQLFCIYLPYLVVPLALVLTMSFNEYPFGKKSGKDD